MLTHLIFVVFASWLGMTWAEVEPLTNSPYALAVQMEKDLNDQINLEYEAFYLYEQLAAFFARSDKALFGFSAYFRKAADEELHHAHELTEVLNKRLGTLTLKNIMIPLTLPTSWSKPAAALRMALQKEVEVSEAINEMYRRTVNFDDHHLQDTLDHIVREQVEAIFNIRSLISRLEGKSDAVEYLIDQELLKTPSMHN